MFVGCCEISISVIVKHVQGSILSAWRDLLIFSGPGRTGQIAGL